MVDKQYWIDFYKKGEVPTESSSFAASVLPLIPKDTVLFELGCGNGRDAFYFARNGINVVATDLAETVVDLRTPNGNPEFVCGDFTNLATPFRESVQIGVIYSRFTLHSVPAEGASRTLKWAFSNLKPGGVFFIEVRSVKDPMYGKGTAVEGQKDAFINTHYRRFVRKDELVAEMEQLGFELETVIEEDNLAVYKDDNPVVIRIHARKPLPDSLRN